MPDGTVRSNDKDGKDIYHFMAAALRVNTRSLPISCAKSAPEASEKACLFMWCQYWSGAVRNTCKASQSDLRLLGLDLSQVSIA
jgi:hypothetical protein